MTFVMAEDGGVLQAQWMVRREERRLRAVFQRILVAGLSFPAAVCAGCGGAAHSTAGASADASADATTGDSGDDVPTLFGDGAAPDTFVAWCDAGPPQLVDGDACYLFAMAVAARRRPRRREGDDCDCRGRDAPRGSRVGDRSLGRAGARSGRARPRNASPKERRGAAARRVRRFAFQRRRPDAGPTDGGPGEPADRRPRGHRLVVTRR